VLELRNISKRLGQKAVLRNISFQMGKKDVLFILGKSGVGKSVLLKTIVGLIRQDSGEVVINGEVTSPRNEEKMAAIRKQCGLVFQNPTLLDFLTVQENLQFAFQKNITMGSLSQALSWMNLGPEVLNLYPFELSFGVQKKISVLRTLLLEPDYVFFDEPTTGLDPVSAENTNQIIKKSTERFGAGVIVVSHDVKAALSLAHRICVLEEGQFVFQGSPDEFRSSSVPLVRSFLKNTVFL